MELTSLNNFESFNIHTKFYQIWPSGLGGSRSHFNEKIYGRTDRWTSRYNNSSPLRWVNKQQKYAKIDVFDLECQGHLWMKLKVSLVNLKEFP